MFLLDAALAQSIVDRAMQILHTNVNVMDERGLIIASGERTRIGSRHDGALLVLAQGRAVEIDDALASRLHDARPGINLPLRAEGRLVGVVGLSGAPADIRQHAELVRMAAETMLEQARLMRVLARDERLREELVLQLIGAAAGTPAAEWALEWARRLQVDLAVPRVALLIDIDAPALAADAVLAEQQRLRQQLSALEPGVLSAPVSLRELAVLLPVPSGEGDPPRLRARVERLQLRLAAEGAHVRFALGGLFAGVDGEGLVRSWQSARATLRVGRRRQPGADVHCYADLTLAVLLAGLAEGWRADELQRPLQRLAAHDRDGQLRRTLAAWFAHDMKTAPSAAALHVHRNTLDYRLRRIADLTGLDLARLDDCLLLFIGLELGGTDKL
jgi:carbohydrate diacid regulator